MHERVAHASGAAKQSTERVAHAWGAAQDSERMHELAAQHDKEPA
jgi:hypothetical protein